MHDPEIDELIERAELLPHGDSKVRILEQAIRLADHRQNLTAGFKARKELVECSSFSGHWELIPLHFSWLLSTADQNPDQFSPLEILWDYLGAVQSLTFFPQIPKSQIHEAQKDLTNRFKRAGLDPVSPLHILFLNSIELGDMELAKKYHAELMELNYLPENLYRGNEHSRYCRGWFRTLIGEEEAGLADLQAVWERRSDNPVIKGYALGVALPVMLRMGKTEELGKIAAKAISEIRGRRELIEPYSELVLFLARSENIAKLLNQLTNFAAITETASTLFEQFQALLAMRVAITALIRAGNTGISLQLPAKHPLFSETGTYDLAELEADYRNRAQAIASQFDQRNGNGWFQSRLNAACDDENQFISFYF